MLISSWATRWERGEASQALNLVQKFVPLFWLWKTEVENPHKTETLHRCIFKTSGGLKMFTSWWRQQYIWTRNNLQLYLSEEFYTTEQKILNASICLFQPFGNIKITGTYSGVTKTNQHLIYENLKAILLKIKTFNWDVGFPLFLVYPFIETMLLSKSLISKIFWDLIDFGFKKMMEKI